MDINGTIPGPTFRCTEGDLLRFHFTNKGSHPHSIHFHGIHPPEMDGIAPIDPGKSSLMNLKQNHMDYKFTIVMYYL